MESQKELHNMEKEKPVNRSKTDTFCILKSKVMQ